MEGKKLDSVIHYLLLKNNLQNNIISSGQGGARSKFVYRNMFEDKTNPYSSKFIIDNNPDFCIIICGTGDAISQVGKNNYTYHMILIVKTLLKNNIRPVIVELPEIGVYEVIEKLSFFAQVRTRMYAYMTNSGVVDNIQTYRNQLRNELIIQGLNKSITFVEYDNICDDYSVCKDIYADPLHLSEAGNIKLGKEIANVLITSKNIHDIRISNKKH